MRNHYSDEDLLSHLDGEISKSKKEIVTRHLENCWLCRTRQSELEVQIRRLSEQVEGLRIDPLWKFQAGQKIAAFERQFENKLRDSRGPRLVKAPRWMFAAGLALCAVAIALVLFLRAPDYSVPSPALLVKGAKEAEVKLAQAPIHQVFDIHEVQIQPKGPSRASRLEIWSDGPSKRFASKWTGSGGSLKHAIWDSGAKPPLIYTSQKPVARKMPSLPHSGERNRLPAFPEVEPNLDSMEAQFMRWLEGRPWRPIALLPDVSLWESSGAVMRVNRIASREVRLLVRREQHGVIVEFTAVLGANGSMPRLQTLRVEAPERVVEFQLSSEQVDTSPRFSPVVFTPDRTLRAKILPPGDLSQPDKRKLITGSNSPLLKPSPDVSRLVEAVQAHFILHLAGACQGVFVRVSQESGGVRVRSEAQPGTPRNYFTNEAGLAEVMGALAEIRYSEKPASAELENGARFSLLVKEADALAMLAKVFDRSAVGKLPRSSLHLLNRMVQDHAVKLRGNLALGVTSSGTNPDDEDQTFNVKKPRDWWSAASLIAKNARALESASPAMPEALQWRLLRMRKASAHLDELLQRQVENEQRTASLHGMRTSDGK